MQIAAYPPSGYVMDLPAFNVTKATEIIQDGYRWAATSLLDCAMGRQAYLVLSHLKVRVNHLDTCICVRSPTLLLHDEDRNLWGGFLCSEAAFHALRRLFMLWGGFSCSEPESEAVFHACLEIWRGNVRNLPYVLFFMRVCGGCNYMDMCLCVFVCSVSLCVCLRPPSHLVCKWNNRIHTHRHALTHTQTHAHVRQHVPVHVPTFTYTYTSIHIHTTETNG